VKDEWLQKNSQGYGDGQQQDDGRNAADGGKLAGGKRTAALAGVAAVVFKVEQVIDDVGRRGAEAEADKGDSGPGEGKMTDSAIPTGF